MAEHEAPRMADKKPHSIEWYIETRGLDRDAVERHAQNCMARCDAYALKEARRARKLTQRQLAAEMGVSQKRISELENGDLERLKVDTLRRYAEGLGGVLRLSFELPDCTIELGGASGDGQRAL